jgi:GNAT superfamily N-acetyltransferase
MIQIRKAIRDDLESLVHIDFEVIGRSRDQKLLDAIKEDRCILAQVENQNAGFLIYHTYFFEQLFIDLLIVHPALRRKGVAKALIEYVENNCTSKKIFSSTNKSNESMQHVFDALHYKQSGYIDNLDEGDPEIVFYKEIRS